MDPSKERVNTEGDVYLRLANEQIQKAMPGAGDQANHSHAWRGAWKRPVYLDENTQHPFTVARMTDHNVRGRDR